VPHQPSATPVDGKAADAACEPSAAAGLTLQRDADGLQLRAHGDWLLGTAAALRARIDELPRAADGEVVELDLDALGELDTSGALLLCQLIERQREAGATVEIRAGSPAQRRLLQRVRDAGSAPCPAAPPARNAFAAVIERLGAGVCANAALMLDFIAFLGRATQVFASGLLRPRQWRITSLVHHMEQVGLNALPIIALIAFLIGVVVAYQGSVQLARFGAQIFVVDGMALSILRELAILLTAVVIAGRSGSAFTAQLGSMVVNEEIDALRALGLDPMQVLVLPRVWALVLSLPLLAFIADMAGLLGGALVCWLVLGIGPALFIERLAGAVDAWDLFVGLVKAPVFAVLIGLVGCHNGLAVERSAESLGRLTTRAVVQAIFLVIVADALFSIFFGYIGL